MQAHLKILRVFYEIASKETKPLTYACRPRELILRLLDDWNSIHQSIKQLEIEGLLTTVQQDTMVIYLTEKGIEVANESTGAKAKKPLD